MRKAFVATICSALVIPGMGQIINENLKKGLTILGLILILFVTGIFQLYSIISTAASNSPSETFSPSKFMEHVKAQDVTMLHVIAVLFIALWIYSVIDAYVCGRKLDMLGKEDPV